MNFLNASDEILSVSEFSKRFKKLVSTNLPELWLRGEVSNLKTYASGHTYFTLKDADSSISAVLFKGFASTMSLKLSEGMAILAYGEVSIYEARGSYQIVIKAMLADGQGNLAQRFLELKEKLEKEGLFDSSRKKPIPQLPKRIAVISSDTGAAIRDFLSILRRRKFSGEVVLFPSLVQGIQAPMQIIGCIEQVESLGNFDLLVLMRGGGSLEDLWAFNDEALARRLAKCTLSTISAIGHEIDFSLTDFVASLRAETPSSAAEYIVASYDKKREVLESVTKQIKSEFSRLYDNAKSRFLSAENSFRLCDPASKLYSFNISLDEISSRLNSLLSEKLSESKNKYHEANTRFIASSPRGLLDVQRGRIDSIEKSLYLMGVDFALKRGYAISKDKSGAIIRRASEIADSQEFTLQYFDGEISVEKK